MNEDISEILNNCIDHMAQGESVETCLSLHPEWAGELEPLLRTAEATFKASAVIPEPGRKAAAKRRFLEAAQAQSTPRRSLLFFPMRTRAIAASLAAIFLAMVAMTGAVAVSADSTPDDPFYPVKRVAENAQLFFARDGDERTALHADLADRRLNELEAIANQRGVIRVNLLIEMMQETDEAINGLDSADDKQRLAERLLQLTSRQQEVLQSVAARVPDKAIEGLERAMEQSKTGHSIAATAVARSKLSGHGEDDEEDKEKSVTPQSGPWPTSTSSRPSPTGQPTAEIGDSLDKDDKSKEEKRGDTGRTPSTRGGARIRIGDDAKRESTAQPSLSSTPATASTPRPDKTRRGFEPTATPTKKESGEKEKHKED